MADTLVIVESPAKAKTIGKYLGSKYIVRASMGHVRDLPKSEMGVAVHNRFEPKYITIRGKGDILKTLKDARKKVKRVFLAADPDREGEAIAWHLAHVLDIRTDEPCRVVFHEITKQAVKDAFKQPRPINMDLVNAQQARRILDRLVGYNISPLLWKKVKKGLSAGRVQSVAVKLISDREREIQLFVPEEYWTIAVELDAQGTTFEAKYYGVRGEKRKLSTASEVDDILQQIAGKPFTVIDIVAKQRLRHPSPPFITSSLQQEAARKLNFRAAKTMQIAQQLYEGIDVGKDGTVGLITYMRTDSTRVSPVAQHEALQYIAQTYGDAYVPSTPRVYAKKNANAQDAHEAIRPTSMQYAPDSLKASLSRDQYRLYKLVWERFMASQMASAVLDTVTADLAVDDVVFRANGSRIEFPGFMKLYIESKDDEATDGEKMLPPLHAHQVCATQAIHPKQHFTQPPPRYTEARLVKELEERGIGRPSTYAPTLETIQKRGYVAVEEKKFAPTELGELVVGLMEQFFPEILNVEFTANMEEHLDFVGDGKAHWVAVLEAFYTTFSERMVVADEEMKQIVVQEQPSGEACDRCGKPMLFKMGRYGKFVACSGFPDCRNAKPIVKTIGVACPQCQEGTIVERRSKKGRIFYGCNTYPTCDFVSWDLPLEKPCPQCGARLVQKTSRRNVSVQCVQCDYRHVRTEEETPEPVSP
jgi:DNA topoisomerase-1